MATAPFSVANNLEIAYRSTLFKLVKSWIPDKTSDLSDTHWLNELKSLSTRKSIVAASTNIVLNMVTRVNVVNLNDWRKIAYKTQGGPQIYHLLREELSGKPSAKIKSYVADTSRYIADIPSDVAKSLLRDIASAQQKGMRPEALHSLIRLRFPTLVESKIKMLARTGVNSASTALTRVRSEELGLPCFVWDTSEDQRVRHSHRIMDGVVVFWGDLPSPEQLDGLKNTLGKYAPGDCPNCRCYPRPILTLQDIFSKKITTVKVYAHGRIETMSQSKFAKLSGIESRIAA